MPEKLIRQMMIPNDFAGYRLDQALAQLFPEFSRTQIQEWIKNGEIKLNGQPAKTRYKTLGGEEIELEASLKPQPEFEPEPIPLDIPYEDEAILIINKPAGIIVHPGAGHASHTLLNALLYHAPELRELPRAGIIHRLDKDTTGLMVIAKTREALTFFTRQLKARKIERIYQAVVYGVMMSGGTVDAPIDRHPIHRKKMSVVETGKPAVTHYRVIERYDHFTHLKIKLETGRTHQIRVHLSYIHYPIVGDATYGKGLQLPKKASPSLITSLKSFKRQALHASELSFTHPITHKTINFSASLPKDLENLIKVFKNDSK